MAKWSYPIALFDKQRQAVSAQVDEVLFGGSLAGGKTEMILKHFVDICLLVPNAKVLVIRKNYPQMVEIEQRLRTRIPKSVATLNKSDHVLTFKHNGSELHLGYLDSLEAAENYQGHEYLKIGLDELTHYDKAWVAEVQSRVRTDRDTEAIMAEHGLQLGMLAASNPGSRGHAWVLDTFIRPAPPNTPFVGEDGVRRIFIPSSLYDNPHINHADYIRRLGNLDPVRKRALIEGDWGIPSGVRFPQFREALHSIPPEKLPLEPFGIPRVVGVDYGFGDPFAAVWMAKVGDIIVVYRCETATDLNSEQQAQRILDLETEHEDGVIALDEMAWARNTAHVGAKLGGDEAPIGSIAYDYRKTLVGRQVVKAKHGPGSRVQRWAQLDRLLAVPEGRSLPRILIYDNCRELITALSSIPRDKRKPEDVDSSSPYDHLCLTGDTLVQTEGGAARLDSIQAGARVWTRNGLRTVLAAARTGVAAPVGTVRFSDGTSLTGTADHPAFTEDGRRVRLDALTYGDTMVAWNPPHPASNPSSTEASPSAATPTPPTRPTGSTSAQADSTSRPASSPSTGRSTRTTTDPSPRASTSTTRTTTQGTTPPTTSSPSTQTTTTTTTPRNVPNGCGPSNTSASLPPPNGTAPRKAGPGTPSTPSTRSWTAPRRTLSVSSAGPDTRPKAMGEIASAPPSAQRSGVGTQGSMTRTAPASTAASPSARTDTGRSRPAPVHVVQPFAATEAQDVYNLTVDQDHEYFANGVLVANCDALSYGYMELLGMNQQPHVTEHERAAAAKAALDPYTAGLNTMAF